MKKKILLIEDEETIIRPLEIALKREKFSLTVARDGEEALVRLKKEIPDLILLDLILPKINGFEVLQKINDDPKTKNIPVIILSNLAREEEIKKGLVIGAKDYFVKTNFSLADLIKKIKFYLLSK